METLSLTLASSIFNFEIQKKEIIQKDESLQRLCFCRKKILENFTIVSQLFFIRVASKIIKFIEDGNKNRTENIDDIIEWYNTEVYVKMFDKDIISSKMILLYKILQEKYDELLFVSLSENLKSLVSSDYKMTSSNIANIFNEISDSLENHLLNIISIKIDCLKIKDSLLSDYGIVDNLKCNFANGCDSAICSLCMKHFPADDWHQTYYDQEEVHFFLDEVDNSDIIKHSLEFFMKYHLNPKNIVLIFDKTLLESDIDYDLSECFEISKINFKRIEFR